jgi:hypothetical protein
VINFRKPFSGEERKRALQPADRGPKGAHAAARIIADYLSEHPGVGKDRIYDHLVSVMVRTGRVEEHSFEASLARVATRAADGSNRWFVK